VVGCVPSAASCVCVCVCLGWFPTFRPFIPRAPKQKRRSHQAPWSYRSQTGATATASVRHTGAIRLAASGAPAQQLSTSLHILRLHSYVQRFIAVYPSTNASLTQRRATPPVQNTHSARAFGRHALLRPCEPMGVCVPTGMAIFDTMRHIRPVSPSFIHVCGSSVESSPTHVSFDARVRVD